MLRKTLLIIAVCATAQSAAAEVWMVRPSNEWGCREREALLEMYAAPEPAKAVPEGCVSLYSGERLLDHPEDGYGFYDTLRVQRGDGSVLFVRSSAVVTDPGIGSVIEDRPE